MPKLVLTRGIPASGKSSWAKAWVQEDPAHRIRVCRDDLRSMMFGTSETLLPYEQEAKVTEAETAIALSGLRKGHDVVVDGMNLRAKYVKRWYTLGYPVEFQDFPVGLPVALSRNFSRGGKVPPAVIEKLYKQFTPNMLLPDPPPQEAVAGEKVEFVEGRKDAVIVDIDGTLAHIPEGGRSPYDYSRVSEDVVDESIRLLVQCLDAEGIYVIVMSGREEACRVETMDWLVDNGIPFDHLFMRPTGDGRKDAKVKLELFNNHVRDSYNVFAVFDDRNQVVDMWRSVGLKCLQVQPGDF